LEIVHYLRQTIPERLRTIALFGSKARGDSHPGSDIDVLVIIDQDDRVLQDKILTRAAQISLDYDVLLSLRVIGEPRWQQMRGFTLYQNVLNEAIGLNASEGQLVLEQPVSL
jgi:predicted nucleotidyltransferase